MSENVSSVSKVFFPQADLESLPQGPERALDRRVLWHRAQFGAPGGARHQHALSARSPRRLAALAKELIDSYDVTIKVIPADLTQASARARLYPEAHRQLGRVDILVNNAGIYLGGQHDHRSDEDDLMTALINIVAPQQLTRAALHEMRPRGTGHIIHIGSIAGMAALPYSGTYAASKSANVGFNQSLQGELQETGVFSTVRQPGLHEERWPRGSASSTPAMTPSGRRRPPMSQRKWCTLCSIRDLSPSSQTRTRSRSDGWLRCGTPTPWLPTPPYNQLQIPAFMADVAKRAATLGPLELDGDAPPTRLAR